MSAEAARTHAGASTMLLVMEGRRSILDRLYESISGSLPRCDIFRLDSSQQENLAGFFRENDPSGYERIVISSRIKRLLGQERVLSLIDGLVFFEYDAWQNYVPEDKYFGQYSRFYRAIPGCRVVSSGCGVARRLRAEGIVNTRREGKSVIYHLAREEAALIVTVLRDAFCKRPHG